MSEASSANREALERISAVTPMLVGLKRAGEFIPTLLDNDVLHAGPPIEGWHEACGALRGSILGTLVHSGYAENMEEARAIASNGGLHYLSANDHGVLGTFAGVITRKTPLFVVKDPASGGFACAAINEGRGKALRYGAIGPETLSRLKWLESDFYELLDAAIQKSGPIDVNSIIEQALSMGDDGHSRQKAASSLFLNMIAPSLVDTGGEREKISLAMRCIASNDFFFLPITIAAAKLSLTAGAGVPGSTVVTCMATNGARFGIQISARPGKWFTAPVPKLHGRYFREFSETDAGPMIGDSVISETIGLGAFAMAGAPALAPYVGGTYENATRMAMEMYRITVSEHPRYKIPALGHRGTPFGIDANEIVSTRITPIFNSGIAHRESGIGQVGAGFGYAPRECFELAVETTK